MIIGLDAMGGDFAPKSTVLGALQAIEKFPEGCHLALIGDESLIQAELKAAGVSKAPFKIIHAEQVIEMAEHPVKAFSQKPKSSLSIGFHLLKEQQIHGICSAGNTGAMLVGSMYTVKAVPGVVRPAIASVLPKLKGGFGVLLDVGANADCKPDVLLQFGKLGSLYSQYVYGTEKPKVALLNIGEEEEKGNLLTQATYQLMKDFPGINFIGNIEGRDLFTTEADVVVCDGFTGNVVLKMAESFYGITMKKKIQDEFFTRFNYENYGGSPILGVNAPVVIGHGISTPLAIENMILHTLDMAKANLQEKFKTAFN